MANKSKLSGGIFYSILIEGKMSGHKEGNTNPDLLADLINFFDDDYRLVDQNSNTISKYCAQYRDGKKTSGAGLPFDKGHLTSSFHERLQTDYAFFRSKMIGFVKNHMERSSDIKTANSLLSCLESDGSISDTQLFFCGYDGSSMTKENLLKQSVICFETLLLGIWDFIISNRPLATGTNQGGNYKDIEVRRFDEWGTTRTSTKTTSSPNDFSFSPWEQSGFVLTEWNEELIQNIESHRQLFVRTKAIDDVMRHLKKDHVLFLIGDPGSGKTIATEIIAYCFMRDGIEIISTYDYKDTSEILSIVRERREDSQIILIDDCMGQAYFDLGEDQETALRKLISTISSCRNKYLLLNSRITIYNSARNGVGGLAKRLNDFNNNIITLTQPSELERATIYFKHLLFSDPIKNEHYFDLQPEKRYKNIINHKNYTPRIMEYVTSDLFLRGSSPTDYYEMVMKTLSNPAKIWDDEFNHKLKKRDRLLLTTLYSLTNDKCRTDLCRIAYEKRISLERDIDSTKNNWDEALTVLNGSMIKRSVNDGVDFISVANPSVNDYLFSTVMKSGSSEWKAIESSIVAMKQIMRLQVNDLDQNMLFSRMGRDGTILSLIFDNEEEKCFYVSLCIVLSGVLNKSYFRYVEKCFVDPKCHRVGIICFGLDDRERVCEKIIMDNRLRNFYLPGEKTVKAINSLIENCSRYDLFRLLESFISLPSGVYDPKDPINKKSIFNAIDQMIDEYASDYWDKIQNVAEKYAYNARWIAEEVDQDISEDLYSNGPDADILPEFICDYFNDEVSNRYFCSEEDVEQALKEIYDEPEQEIDSVSYYSGPDSIAEMFERESLK